MADLEQYFAAISEEKAKLDDTANYTGFIFMTSVRNLYKNSTAGSVAEVSTKIAARQLVDGVARPSTPEEIEAFKQRGILFAARMSAAEERRNPAMGRVILMPPDTRGGK
jgi:hypothetical protein